MPYTRYAHSEGHTDIVALSACGFATCGSDGDVRIWENIKDAEQTSHAMEGNCAICMAVQSDKILVGTKTIRVQLYNLPKMDLERLVVRFTAPCTAAIYLNNGKLVACGSSDMTCKVVSMDTSKEVLLNGHTGPVFSLAGDPKGEYLASSSGDTCVRLWNVKELESIELVKTWPGMVPKCNDFFASTCLGRCSWTPDGKFLMIPGHAKLSMVARGTWETKQTLRCKTIERQFSCCCVSSNGLMVAVGTVNGKLIIWQVNSFTYPNYEGAARMRVRDVCRHSICSIIFSGDSEEQVLCTNYGGEVCSLQVAELFSEDEADVADKAGVEQMPAAVEENGFDGLTEMDTDVRADSPSAASDGGDSVSNVSVGSRGHIQAVTVTKVQRSFQPGSTPDFLENHFMCFNEVGYVIKQGVGERFVRANFFSAEKPNLVFPEKYTLASLSDSLIALSYTNDDNECRLDVQLLSDNSNRITWSEEYDVDETIVGIASSTNFVAVVTSLQLLRIYAKNGFVREVISIPGVYLSMAAKGNAILIVCHNATGVSSSQCLKAHLYKVTAAGLRLNFTEDLPTLCNETIQWVGLSTELLPVSRDSAQILRLRIPGLGWVPYKDGYKRTKSAPNLFVVGCSYMEKNVLGIPCNNMPQIFPEPTVQSFGMESMLTSDNAATPSITAAEEALRRISHYRLLESSGHLPASTSIEQPDLYKTILMAFSLTAGSRNNIYQDIFNSLPHQALVQKCMMLADRLNIRLEHQEEEEDEVELPVVEDISPLRISSKSARFRDDRGQALIIKPAISHNRVRKEPRSTVRSEVSPATSPVPAENRDMDDSVSQSDEPAMNGVPVSLVSAFKRKSVGANTPSNHKVPVGASKRPEEEPDQTPAVAVLKRSDNENLDKPAKKVRSNLKDFWFAGKE